MQKKQVTPTFLRMIKLLNDTNQYSRRHDYAFRHSNARTESTKELKEGEMYAIIKELEDTFKVFDQCDKMRKKIIAKAHLMFWELPNGKVDMNHLNYWCETQGPYKKELNKHDIKELAVLVTVFDKVYTHFMSKL